MNAFPIGISALAVGRRGMDLAGQNIANASTPGYRRQTLNAVTRVSGNVGTGVAVSRLTRYDAPPVRTAILAGTSEQSFVSTRLSARQQIETALGTGDGSIGGKLDQLFNNIEALSSRPSESASRRQVISSASELAGQFNSVAGDLDRLKFDLGQQTTQTVNDVNSLTSQIADLNGRIESILRQGQQANELQDQRDQLVENLSKKVDMRVVNMDYGVVNVIGHDTALVVSNTATKLAVAGNSSNGLDVTVSGQTTPLSFNGGELGGLLREYNVEIPATRARLDTLAMTAAGQLDKIQATGLGLDGPVTSLVGTRSVADPTQPLATQGLNPPMTAGTLLIHPTDLNGQTRQSMSITVDPNTMSLNDLAAAITSGTAGLVQATVDTPQNVLRLTGQAGIGFDFSGRPDSPPMAMFASPTVNDTDTANVLGSLGVGGLFTGTDAGTLKVRPEIVADPDLLATSRSGRSGDAANLERFAALRDQPLVSGRTLSAEYVDLASSVGVSVKSLGDQQTAQAGLLQNLNAQEQSIAGVDINEELLHLLDYQRMVEGASRFMSVVNSALDSVFEITQ